MKRSLTIIILIVLILFCPLSIHAWDDYDYDSGDYIEIENPELVAPGKDIQVYDFSDGAYHDVNVISVVRDGTVIIEVFDHDTGDYRTFEMEDESKAKDSTISNVL